MLTREQGAIFTALTAAQGSAITLKFPKSGEFLSAFVFLPQSVSNNGVAVERVMVFYEREGLASEPAIWLTFLEKHGSENWRVTHDRSFFATAVEQISFIALGERGGENIIITTSVAGQADKTLHVIAFCEDSNAVGGQTPQQVYQREFCVYYEAGDFKGEGANMLMSINSGGGEHNDGVTAEFVTWQGDEFVVRYSIPTDSAAGVFVQTITAFVPVEPSVNYADDTTEDGEPFTERLPEKSPVLLIEYARANGYFYTDIIVWCEKDSRPPRNITLRGSNLEKRPNRYTAYAYSRVLDGSGVMRVARNTPANGYRDDVPVSERVRIAIWHDIVLSESGDRLAPLYHSFLGLNNDYVFFFSTTLPNLTQETTTVTVNLEPCSCLVSDVTVWQYDSEVFTNVYDVTTPLVRILSTASGESPCANCRDEFPERIIRFDSKTNDEFDYYVQIFGASIKFRELREVLRVF